ncbi:putative domain HDIG [Methanocella conradii HZ254]|uniref:Domain HDIG n=1 Tax=Methanocella conradii (strain DSM 24694 / JCM 17849 / CGMCC 1.5162 / HZ254) TaxID=1041930 RepID=H8I9N7_METCZ|nr:HDIG domain-containing metalloprotein [Methanocella conradii]AFD00488.1 putative domain HDIG [Methanocella conradii HZ254]
MIALTKKDALDLLKKYGADKRLMDHLWAVHDYAMEIAEKASCDRSLVEVGSLLHDIGRTRSHGIDHAIVGAEILRKEGVDERVVNIVERHIGAGLTPEEAEKLGLPPRDYVPKSIEEKIVCHADNLIGSSERISIKDTIKMASQKWSPSSVDRLIEMHFEVFKPDVVRVNEKMLKKACGDLKNVEKCLDGLLKGFDLLYRMRMENGITVEMFGQDSEKAARYLEEKGVAAPA